MSKLPRVSGRECAKALAKVGFYLKRQEGSHMILRRDDPFGQVVVPDHKELDRGYLTTGRSKRRGFCQVVVGFLT